MKKYAGAKTSALKISIKPMDEGDAEKEMKKATPQKAINDMPAPVSEDSSEEETESPEFEKYELEDAVRTLTQAAEIKHNAPLMKAIGPMLDKKKKAINSLDDLRAVAKDKMN